MKKRHKNHKVLVWAFEIERGHDFNQSSGLGPLPTKTQNNHFKDEEAHNLDAEEQSDHGVVEVGLEQS